MFGLDTSRFNIWTRYSDGRSNSKFRLDIPTRHSDSKFELDIRSLHLESIFGVGRRSRHLKSTFEVDIRNNQSKSTPWLIFTCQCSVGVECRPWSNTNLTLIRHWLDIDPTCLGIRKHWLKRHVPLQERHLCLAWLDSAHWIDVCPRFNRLDSTLTVHWSNLKAWTVINPALTWHHPDIDPRLPRNDRTQIDPNRLNIYPTCQCELSVGSILVLCRINIASVLGQVRSTFRQCRIKSCQCRVKVGSMLDYCVKAGWAESMLCQCRVNIGSNQV